MEKYKIPGTIKFFGSPAEETLTSRFSTGYGVSGTALISAIFTFKGITAHAAGSPWTARSALDGVELMNVATNYLREHLHYTHRLHYVVTEGGEAPNVVPDRASLWYYVRNTDERLEAMYERVLDCAKALQKVMGANETGFPKDPQKLSTPPTNQVGGGSSDVGDVTLVAPTATIRFPGIVPDAISHHWSYVASSYGSAAWKGLNAGAKAISASALDLLTRPKLLEDVRKEFEEYMKERPYKSFLPPGAQPPLELNKQLMDKFRDSLMKMQVVEN